MMAAAAPVDRYPLSAMQQSMVVLSARSPNAGLYLEQNVLSLDEELDVGCLRRAWERMVDRHAILRTTIELDADGLRQSVHERVDLLWGEQDLTAQAPAAADRALAELLAADRAQGFDFAAGPPHRVLVVRLAGASYRFVWTHHHVIIDRPGWLILVRELFACYDAWHRGQAFDPGPAPPPFAEHVRWLGAQDWSRSEGYWRDRLAGFREPVRVAIESGRRIEVDAENAFGREYALLPDGLARELEAFAAAGGITLNTLVQGAWAILLARYTGRDDVIFGATRGCRRSSVAGAERIVGPLLNTIPVRVAVTPDAALLPWLATLREQWVALRDHEHTPIGLIHDWSELPKGVALFESVVVFERDSFDAAMRSPGGAGAHRGGAVIQRSDTPLTLFGHAKPALGLGVAYDRTRFEPSAIVRLLGHLRTLLEGFVRSPDARLADLPMLTADERRRIHEVWNATTRAYPRDACVHHLFEQQARQQPGQIALVDGSRTLSYAETNARANRLAHRLQRLAISPDRLVGVYLGRTPDEAIAVLAVLKAGGAFLVLDPEAPTQRLRYIVADARLVAVITTRELVAALDGMEIERVCIDADEDAIAREPAQDPAPLAAATDLAYAVYTSGTTGGPKGTLITHRALVNFVHATAERYGITATDRRAQFASLSSDVHVAEIFVQLAAGAALVYGLRSGAPTIEDFIGFLDRNGITIAGMPASYWHEWVASMREGGSALPRSLRLVVCGMEQVHGSAFETWRRTVGGRLRWFNAYGPSETTITAATYEAPPGERGRTIVPIGKPVANVRIYLLDPNGNLAPAGVVGEICIGGDGLARGYLERPELTAAKFVPDPFRPETGARLYRSGDLGAWLDDGNIVFLGRHDEQVKIRGYRVELAEIEETMREHPDVRDCALAAGGEGEQTQLFAFVVSRSERAVAADELRRFLAARLPSYMMPAAILRIDGLPLTATGKVDRSRLPVPARAELDALIERVPPRDETERRMAALFATMLGRELPSVHADVFAAGFDSLLAVRAAACIQATFGARLSVRDVFAHPTVAGLAVLVRDCGACAVDHGGAPPPIVAR